MLVFLVVLDFLLCWGFGGLDPHRPLLPIPLPRPRNLALAIPPLVRVPLLPPVEIDLILCSVFCLQYGQYLFVFLGIFIIKSGF